MAKIHILHIRVEPKVKEKAEEILNDLGLSISEAVSVFLNQAILNEGIPFEIRKNRYSNSTIKVMEDTKHGKNLSNTFDSVDKMFEELDKQCQNIQYTNKFKKDYRLIKKRGYDINKLKDVIEILTKNHRLPEKYREHF